MAILIKDMDKPDNCRWCPFRKWAHTGLTHYCSAMNDKCIDYKVIKTLQEDENAKIIPKWCPIVEVKEDTPIVVEILKLTEQTKVSEKDIFGDGIQNKSDYYSEKEAGTKNGRYYTRDGVIDVGGDKNKFGVI